MAESERKIKRILVAVDGSSQSFKAVRIGAELAKSTRAVMTLLAVSEVADMPELMMEDRIKSKGAVMDSILEEAAEIAISEGADVQTALRHGHPANQILKYAKENDIDMIVIGSRGLGDTKGMIMGSVSRAITKGAEMPVLIVR
jgi:nucleotide-binding universal stress UspA family protein